MNNNLTWNVTNTCVLVALIIYNVRDEALNGVFKPSSWGGGLLPLFYAQNWGWVDTWVDVWVDKIDLAKTKCLDWVDIWVDTFNTFVV